MKPYKDAKSESIKQAEFCMELMKRIVSNVNNAEEDYGRIKNYTRIQADVTRLRRELLTLGTSVYPW